MKGRMSSDDVATDSDAGAQPFDVTIHLVQPKHGNVAMKKRKRSNESRFPLESIHADSRKLRQCSKYFDTYMSTRWNRTSTTQTEFYLEAHTETRFYKDCFDRMHDVATIQPISSVTDCTELLKVASQIEFSLVLEIGVRYLASVPWSDNDELHIREFLNNSGHLYLSSHSTLDLRHRLGCNTLPTSGLQLQGNYLRRVLSRSLTLSMTGSTWESRNASCRAFKATFDAIVNGYSTNSSKRGDQAAWQIAVAVVKEEMDRLWGSITKELREGVGLIIRPRAALQLMEALMQFAWVYSALRGSNAAQEVVEILLADHDIGQLLQWKFKSFHSGLCSDHQVPLLRAEQMWAGVMGTVFRDILDGKLFLDASERRGLFREWSWVLKGENFEWLHYDAASIAALICSFIMTFPQAEQEEIFDRWLTGFDGPAGLQQEASTCDLSEAYSLWLTHVISKAVIL